MSADLGSKSSNGHFLKPQFVQALRINIFFCQQHCTTKANSSTGAVGDLVPSSGAFQSSFSSTEKRGSESFYQHPELHLKTGRKSKDPSWEVERNFRENLFRVKQ